MKIQRHEFFKDYKRLIRLYSAEEIQAAVLWRLQRGHHVRILKEIEEHAEAYRKHKETHG